MITQTVVENGLSERIGDVERDMKATMADLSSDVARLAAAVDKLSQRETASTRVATVESGESLRKGVTSYAN